MSRHTQLTGEQSISRSLGSIENQDFVATLQGDRKLELRLEPLDRRMKRGEKCESMVVDLEELWDARAKPKEIPTDSFVDDLIRKLPIADFSGAPDKVGYAAKVWLLNELKKLREK